MAVQDNTSGEYADKIISSDGTILGGLFALPAPLRAAYQVFQGDVKRFLSDNLGGKVAEGTKWIGRAIPGTNPAMVEKVGDIAGKAVALGVPYIDTAGGLVKIYKDYGVNSKTILGELAPLLAAKKADQSKGVAGSIKGFFKSGYEGNRSVERALKVVKDLAYHDTGRQLAYSLPNAVNTYGTVIEGRHAEAAATNNEAAMAAHEKILGHLGMALKVSGAISEGVAQMVPDGDPNDKIRKSSYGLEKKIAQYLHTEGLEDPTSRGSDGQIHDVADLLKEAFRQFQKEDGSRPLPTRRLEEVSNMVAEELVRGNLNALSVFDIVGTGELLVNNKGDSFRSNDEIKKILQKEENLLPKGATINVSDYLSEKNFTLDDVKRHAQSKNKDERALVAFFEPDAVLLAAGMKKEEIKELRDYASDKFIAHAMTEVVQGLNTRTDDDLRKLNFNDDDIYLVRTTGENPQALTRALQTPGYKEDLKRVAANAVMGEGDDYWRSLVASGKSGGHKDRDVTVQELNNMPGFKASEDARRAGAGSEAAFSKN